MKPLILTFKTLRKGENNYEYSYDEDQCINVMDLDGEKVPVIEYDDRRIELMTKTKVRTEMDDESLSILELETKTEANVEKDDEEPTLMELMTKTKVRPEQDEEQPSILELETKTFAKTERDDEGSSLI